LGRSIRRRRRLRPKREEIWKSRPQIIDFTAPPGDPEVEECPGGDG